MDRERVLVAPGLVPPNLLLCILGASTLSYLNGSSIYRSRRAFTIVLVTLFVIFIALLIIQTAYAYSPVLVTHFQNDTAVVVDDSGYGYNGTVYGGNIPELTEKARLARWYDGVNDYVRFDSTVVNKFTTPNITFGTTINTRSLTVSSGTNINVVSRYYNSHTIKISTSTRKVSYEIDVGTDNPRYTGNIVLDYNTTYNIMVTYNGSHLQGYVNGATDGTGIDMVGASLAHTTSSWYLGTNLDQNAFTNLEYYSFFLYNASLSAAEVASLSDSELAFASSTLRYMIQANTSIGNPYTFIQSFNPSIIQTINVPSNAMLRTTNASITFTNISFNVDGKSDVSLTDLRCINGYSPSIPVNTFLINGSCNNVTLTRCSVDGSRMRGTSFDIRPYDTHNIRLRDCSANDTDNFGFQINGSQSYDKYLFDSALINCTANYCGYNARSNDWVVGFDLGEGADDLHLSNVTVVNCSASHCWESGFHTEHGVIINHSAIINCTSNYNGVKPNPVWGAGYTTHGFHIINCIAIQNNKGFYIEDHTSVGSDPTIIESCYQSDEYSWSLYIGGRLNQGINGNGVIIKNHVSNNSSYSPVRVYNIQNVTFSNYTLTNPHGSVELGTNMYAEAWTGPCKNSTFNINYYAPDGTQNENVTSGIVMINCTNITLSGVCQINQTNSDSITVNNCWDTDIRNMTVSGSANGVHVKNIDSAKTQRVTIRHSTINSIYGEYSNAAIYIESTATGVIISDAFSVKIDSSKPYLNNGNLTILMANFTYDVSNGYQPLNVQFHDDSQSFDQLTAWQWNFGDGTANSTDQNPTHTFIRPGEYTVILYCSNIYDGNYSVKTSCIVAYGPTANFTASLTTGNAPLSITFDSSSSTGIIESYFWDFGDGVTSNQANPVHTYNIPNSKYTVQLTVSNTGESNRNIKYDYISVSTYSPTSIPQNPTYLPNPTAFNSTAQVFAITGGIGRATLSPMADNTVMNLVNDTLGTDLEEIDAGKLLYDVGRPYTYYGFGELWILLVIGTLAAIILFGQNNSPFLIILPAMMFGSAVIWVMIPIGIIPTIVALIIFNLSCMVLSVVRGPVK